MFGYLNLNDPTKIGDQESQEANNLRLDHGFLEYQQWPIDATIMREWKDLQGNIIRVTPTTGIGNSGIVERILPAGADTIGILAPSLNMGWNYPTNPTMYNTAVETGPSYPPTKEFNYAITLYDPAAGEESAPFFVTGYTDGTYNLGFKDFPGMGANYPRKTSLEWRIYRRPLGSSEYLQLPHPAIQAVTNNSTSYLDNFEDSALTLPLNTVDNEQYYPAYYGARLLAVHNNRLWVPRPFVSIGINDSPRGHLLYFSKTNVFGETPINNYFSFNSPIVALHSIDETLFVITKESIYAIYGDDDSSFVVKEITNAGIGGLQFCNSAASGNKIIFISSSRANRNAGTGVHLIYGNSFDLISDKISPLFPVAAIIGFDTSGANGAGVIENRFLILGYGRIIDQSSYQPKRLVYDSIANGFVTGDSTTSFTYRSKEFGSPGWWVGARRMFVRGAGNFTVELYGDGEKIDEISFNISVTQPRTEDFTVPPFRCNYFSYRFIGQANAKIYEFGRKE